MFDIGGFELLLIAVVGLLVIGPERLPETLRTLGLWLGRLRRSFTSVKAEIEKEIGMDEVKRQLHNEAVMEEMQRIEREVKNSVDDARIDPGVVSTGKTNTTDVDTSAAAASATPAKTPVPQDESNHDAATDHSDAGAQDIQPLETPATPIPPTEAELEAAYERKMRAGQAGSALGKEDQA